MKRALLILLVATALAAPSADPDEEPKPSLPEELPPNPESPSKDLTIYNSELNQHQQHLQHLQHLQQHWHNLHQHWQNQLHHWQSLQHHLQNPHHWYPWIPIPIPHPQPQPHPPASPEPHPPASPEPHPPANPEPQKPQCYFYPYDAQVRCYPIYKK